jgi:hypothetical protein
MKKCGVTNGMVKMGMMNLATIYITFNLCSQIVSVLKDVAKIELYSWMWAQIGLSFTCVNGKTFTISFLLSSSVCMGVDIVYKL